MCCKKKSMSEGHDYVFKIIVIGDSGVGKSSLTLRLTDDVFYNDHANTIGIDFRMHCLTVHGKTVRLHVWDTAGQERFQNMAASFYRGANGILLCFDVTSKFSFTNLEKWMERVRLQAVPSAPLVLVGCKCDDTARREVTSEDAVLWAAARSIPYIETSARCNMGVALAFQMVAMAMMASSELRPNDRTSSSQLYPPGRDRPAGAPILISETVARLRKDKKCCL